MNLLLGLIAMLLCLFLQALLFVAVMRYYTRKVPKIAELSFAGNLVVVSGVLVQLVIGALLQVALWAGLFFVLDEFASFQEAFYHSAVNFATLGYGDFVMSEQHKLLGPLEALNGVIMIGLSTSALTLAFQDIFKRSFAHNQANGK